VSAVLLVALGAALGAVARHVAEVASARRDPSFPWGTLAVNLVGSFAAGLVVALRVEHGWSENALLFLVVGFCGALTTFSGFAYQSTALSIDGRRTAATAYVGVSVLACLALAVAGYALGALGGT
jgi:CrcB protein